jgi:hypothetical protein
LALPSPRANEQRVHTSAQNPYAFRDVSAGDDNGNERRYRFAMLSGVREAKRIPG